MGISTKFPTADQKLFCTYSKRSSIPSPIKPLFSGFSTSLMGHLTKQSLCSLCCKRRSSRTQHVQDVQVCSRKTCVKTRHLLERALMESSSPVIKFYHYHHVSYVNKDIPDRVHYSCELHAKEAPNIGALAELPENIVRPQPEAYRY